ncbi:hypothetical protein FHG87_021431 [Trinorchestia longiramus]|nr:hypothetical protein FHG87_021431 [Trinorchestia longiramus]
MLSFLPANTPVFRGHLFRSCANQAVAIKGSLYSINVAEGKDFVRFVTSAPRDIEWTDTKLGKHLGVVQCAIKASELQATVFKYDSKCWVSFEEFEAQQETGCGDGEILYVLTSE